MEKRGQVAIFVIVAIVIVAAIVIVLSVTDNLPSFLGGAEFNPITFLTTCIEPEINEGISLLAKQGGYAEPAGFIYRAHRWVWCVLRKLPG